MAKCSIRSCRAPLVAHGLCRKHYLRKWRHGSPSTVKLPKDYVPRGAKSPQYRHGRWQHPLYKTWRNMISRCENPEDSAYHNYGGRGITVCERWHDIKNFIADMGERPMGMTLERADNAKGYEPSNCRWDNRETQSRNRRYTKLTADKALAIRLAKGTTTRKALAAQYGVSEATIKKVWSGSYWRTAEKVVPSVIEAIKK